MSMKLSVLAGMSAVAMASSAAAEPGWTVPEMPVATNTPFLVPPKRPYVDPALLPLPGSTPAALVVPTDMGDIARIGGQWGKVTSVLRTPEHNRKVGGVPNSYHLSGRAIDIARRSGVRHADIAAALTKAGFQLIESLDEGDHSHFAFAKAGDVVRAAAVVKPLFQLAAFDVDTGVDGNLPRPAPRGSAN